MNNHKYTLLAGIIGLGLFFGAADTPATAAVVTLLSEDFSGFTTGAQSSGTVNGWTVHPGSKSTVNIINAADTNNSNALGFAQPDTSGVAYIQKSFTPAANSSFQFTFDMAQLAG
jgi:hypothetical protein